MIAGKQRHPPYAPKRSGVLRIEKGHRRATMSGIPPPAISACAGCYADEGFHGDWQWRRAGDLIDPIVTALIGIRAVDLSTDRQTRAAVCRSGQRRSPRTIRSAPDIG